MPDAAGASRRASGRGSRLLLSALATVLAACAHAPTPEVPVTPPPRPEHTLPPPLPSGSPWLERGVSREGARSRALALDSVRYTIRLSVPASAGAPIRGTEVARMRVRGDQPYLVIDFQQPPERLLSLRLDGAPAPYRLQAGHIIVQPENGVASGEHAVEMEFLAGDGSLNRNPDYLYALFVPDRASVALPLIDQPDVKARFTLELEVPADWVAVSNGADTREAVDSMRVRYRFAETKPIATYLFAFAAGKWQIETAVRNGRTFRMLHRESDSTRVARNRDAIFDLQAKALAWLEEYTGIPYPWGKFDFVAVPAFQFGGMEHPGAIYYRAESLFLDESATQSQMIGRATLLAHETAHMWFGDLVTMRWFDDVWTKEVFANFMAAKVVNPAFPEVDHALRFYLSHFPSAYSVDRTAGANPIHQELDNLRDAGTLYGAIIYDKAPIVMQHLENRLRADRFREGLQEYLHAFAYGNATWDELIAILDRRTPEDLAAWSRIWVEEAGRPGLAMRMTSDADGRIDVLEIRQTDPAGKHRLWPQRLDVLVGCPGRTRLLPVDLRSAVAELSAARGLPWPCIVLPGAGGLGYGDIRLDVPSRNALLRSLPLLDSALARGVGWVTLWDAMLQSAISPDTLLEAGLRALDAEDVDLNVQRTLADVGTAYWRFLGADARDRVAPRLESLLWSKIEAAPTQTLQASYFHAYEDIALTPEAVDRLRRLWGGELEVKGLAISERDRTSLALELALRGVPDADSILSAQLAAIRDADRRRRLEFLRPAVSADPARRDSFFASLRDPANRAHESWVLDGLRYLHHPLRSGRAIRYIQPSLDMLEEIQRTGDVFFPGRWMDATLGGHSEPAAAVVVHRFLDRHPDYPPKLREKILQAADGLFRAASIVGEVPEGPPR